MNVKVYASGFCSFEHIDDDGFMSLPEGASLNDVLKKLGIPYPLRRILFAAVNYEHVKLNTRLKDGDVVSLLSARAGG
ncbi:MAG: MoaD/ThiS family protein [bacterium]|nr:molybdopterin converting factor subunit 1 [Deltaproteobacteria bacterium]MCP4906159.1 MoaD/ThiS family protein [bacterium]